MDSDAPAEPVRHRSPQIAPTTFGRSLAVTALGAVLPGSALIMGGRRRAGTAILAVSVVLLLVALWLATAGRRTALHAVLSPGTLLLVAIALPLLALAWVVVVVAGYRLVSPGARSDGQRALGAGLVALLCLALVLPTLVASRYAVVQRDLITTVFGGADRESATAPTDLPRANPWASKPRVNLLLLGSDAGPGREGTRTDTVIVASIDTRTGNTVLFSLPRNLENLPFPPGRLRDVYPDGFSAPGNEGEQLLNAVYRNVPEQHPGILGPTADLGADVLKLGVGEALGLSLDYYLLVDLDGFQQLVDALGGVTVNINNYVAINGDTDARSLPDDYLTPGAAQHLNGFDALWFARGRYGSTDYDRMDRQRCVINAIITQADPVRVLRQYQQLAATTKDVLTTDIPSSLLPAFVDLSLLVKDASATSVVFDNSVITPAYADYNLMRQIVAAALNPPPTTAAPSSSSAAPVPSGTAATPTSTVVPGTPETLTDTCAFDPVAAAAALAQGKPPTKR